MTLAEVYEALGKQDGGKAWVQELTEKGTGDRAASGKMEEWIRRVFLYFSIRKPCISVIIIAI